MRGLPALLDALSDSARIVRVQVPFALMDIGYLPDGSALGDAFRRALDEHRDVVYSVQGDDPGFHESLGQVYEAQGRFEDAKREFEIVARLDPRHPETAADLARLARKQKRFEQMRGLLKGKGDLISRLRAGALLLHMGVMQMPLLTMFAMVRPCCIPLWGMRCGVAEIAQVLLKPIAARLLLRRDTSRRFDNSRYWRFRLGMARCAMIMSGTRCR